MKTRNLEEIKLSSKAWSKRKKNKIRFSVAGLDTETIDGRVFIIGVKADSIQGRQRIRNFKDLISFLLYFRVDRKINFFYNLTFDANAIIKLLPEKNIAEMAFFNETRYMDCLIKLVPNKKLQIDYIRKRFHFYDLAQFYNHKPLNVVSQQLLGEGKEEIENVAELDEKRYDEEEEYRNHVDKYLMKDCELCYRLAENIYTISEKHLFPKYFYSQASLSQQFFLENMPRDYGYLPYQVLDFGLRAYNGGRFETMKRGTYKNIDSYDIRSAYPFHNAKIPALDNGIWRKGDSYDEDADISLFKGIVSGKSYISPLRRETKKSLIYPTGRKLCYFNKTEYETFRKYGYKVKIREAHHYYKPKKAEYPFKFLKDFYYKKEELGKNHPAYMFYKIIINGFYGKMIQLEPERMKTKEIKNADDIELYRGMTTFIKNQFKAGLLFNPVIAQEITANTRCQLLNAVVDIQDSVYSFATDSIITDKKPNLKIGSKMGMWDKEHHQQDLTLLGSGVYFFEGEKMKFRGFGKSLDPQEIFKDEEAEKISYNTKRNIKLKQTFRSNTLTLDDFNTIRDIKRDASLNFDKKRIWEDNFIKVKDVLEKQIDSKPHHIRH